MQKYQFNNFIEIIEANAASSPEHVIIFEDNLKITNQELKEYIDKIANILLDSGIKYNDKVGLVISNCWQFIAIFFAISKIGAISVPVNNFLKEDEIAYILNDSQAKLLFCSAKFASETTNLLIKTNVEQIFWLDGCLLENEKNIDFAKSLANSHGTSSTYNAQENEAAVIVYTSGTTGKPKGAVLSFKNILSNCFGSQKLMDLKNKQIPMLCYLPMFHAFTLTATVMLPIFTNGSVIIIRSIKTKKDFKYLLKQLLLKRCPYFTGVPEIYSAMARAKLPWYFHWFHNVKGFISGAAPLSDEVSRKFSASFKRGVLLQGYGISECSPIVSCNSPLSNRFGSVGKPLYGYEVKIFDEEMKELPVGTVGEICVKGDCVMQGYYNKPEETAEAIIDKWFKTGDLGRVDNENFIYIVDRKKDLIIHKGMNIYPREIEEILYTHPKINACAVVGMKDREESEVPLVYIELKEDQLLTEHEVKIFLKPFLATFKIPRKVIFIDKLPRNATGKILKKDLRVLPIN